MGEPSLNPTVLRRLSTSLRPDWTRTVLARRVAAGGLVVLAGVAALRRTPTVTGRRGGRRPRPRPRHRADPGRRPLEKRSATTLPDGAEADVGAVIGSTLAGPARRGEVLTDVRLLGSRLAESTAGPGARIVPLHLADGALIDLVRVGDVVDVLAAPAADAAGRRPGSHQSGGDRRRRRPRVGQGKSPGRGQRPRSLGCAAGSRGEHGGRLGVGSGGDPHPALSACPRLLRDPQQTVVCSIDRRPQKGLPMLKGFKEFLSRGNIVDLSVAVVIGTAFTALVTKFTDSIITPLINRVGVNQNSDVGILKIDIGGGTDHRPEHRVVGRDQLRPGRRGGVLPGRAALQQRCASGARSSRPTTPKSSYSPRSATCWRRATDTRPAGTAGRHHTASELRTRARTPKPSDRAGPAQISRLDNCPMI